MLVDRVSRELPSHHCENPIRILDDREGLDEVLLGAVRVLAGLWMNDGIRGTGAVFEIWGAAEGEKFLCEV
jgi:hypothetical protein